MTNAMALHNINFVELTSDELMVIDGGVGWDDLGLWTATGGGALIGTAVGGPIGGFIGGGIACVGYILIDKAFK
ncbi:Blp family class II bacteriocin [Petroclostridium xylanilyticum]|jgi:hypothetical protein|uniref:Blp family class II bacteriocin n=1 Tax=Petroclostridium xylanilyticum TaxID=1792311 RepID=UPI000B99A387|nr:Blp family class II bacteriocin [Petroclostridium xylanilyticum]